MKTLYQSPLLALGALALAGTAYAQVPATNDKSSTDAHGNTGNGSGALGTTGANPPGFSNTAFGRDALRSNTTGYSNTASGYQALYLNTAGYYNTASGVSALEYNDQGIDNSAFGGAALFTNGNGNENTAYHFL